VDLQAEVQAPALEVPEQLAVYPARYSAPHVVGAQAHDRAVEVGFCGA
jgi:hypothetical protein